MGAGAASAFKEKEKPVPGFPTLLAVIDESVKGTQSGDVPIALLNAEEQKTRAHALPILRPDESTRESAA